MDELYKQNAKIVYYFVYSLCHDRELAEELTQETFFRAFQSLDRYDGTCKLSSWLCQIAKHLYYQHLRRANREIPVHFSDGETDAGYARAAADASDAAVSAFSSDSAKNPERQAIAKLELLDVLKDMQRLPAQMREVMYLRITGDLSFKEIGDILGRSENWARVNFFRGKELLLKRRMQNES